MVKFSVSPLPGLYYSQQEVCMFSDTWKSSGLKYFWFLGIMVSCLINFKRGEQLFKMIKLSAFSAYLPLLSTLSPCTVVLWETNYIYLNYRAKNHQYFENNSM